MSESDGAVEKNKGEEARERRRANCSFKQGSQGKSPLSEKVTCEQRHEEGEGVTHTEQQEVQRPHGRVLPGGPDSALPTQGARV